MEEESPKIISISGSTESTNKNTNSASGTTENTSPSTATANTSAETQNTSAETQNTSAETQNKTAETQNKTAETVVPPLPSSFPTEPSQFQQYASALIKARNSIFQKIIGQETLPTEITEEISSDEEAGGLYPDKAFRIPKEKNSDSNSDSNNDSQDLFDYEYENENFIKQLMGKQEFADSKQPSILSQFEKDTNPCTREFELTPVQRFVSRLLNPDTPYRSALLYHAVGVGKTCAAITIAEGFLERYPNQQIIVVAPPNIQDGFRKTIFDFDTLKLGKTANEPNTASGCTGNTYLKLTETYYNISTELQGVDKTKEKYESERKREIEYKIKTMINRRYSLMGYGQFAKYIKDFEKGLPDDMRKDLRDAEVEKRLANAFSGRVVIIDEAHNLRDIGESADENRDEPEGEEGLAQSKAGKALTPALKNLLRSANDLTLVLLTGTPMYNSYKEIIFLLNLLLLNEYKRQSKLLTEEMIFNRDSTFTPRGEEILMKVASRYVSFMRGENPLTFPTRLDPMNIPRFRPNFPKIKESEPLDINAAYFQFLKRFGYSNQEINTMLRENKIPNDILELPLWPDFNPEMQSIKEKRRQYINLLPIVPCYFDEDTEEEFKDFTVTEADKSGLGIENTNLLIQAGNWIFPGNEDSHIEERVKKDGFKLAFKATEIGEEEAKEKEKINGAAKVNLAPYRNFTSIFDPQWMLSENLSRHSPKMKFILDRLEHCDGPAFIYSRFVTSGALPIAMCLEANGYVLYGADKEHGILTDGNQHPDGLICSVCNVRQKLHKQKDHSFKESYYILLTSDYALSPNNTYCVRKEQAASNLNGYDIKVIIGSQVAGEGIDFKYIREIFIFDSWFHLNKMEQVIGRGIRYCSHRALPSEKRNCTINMLVNSFRKSEDNSEPYIETMDMYNYRKALDKAKEVGRVSRALKSGAIDCNLNKDVIQIKNLPPKNMIDSQGVTRRNVNLNDIPYTFITDWLKDTTYKCFYPVTIPSQPSTRTYTEFAARWQEQKLKQQLRNMFEENDALYFTQDDILGNFSSFPQIAVNLMLADVVNNPAFRVKVGNHEGYIVFRNGLYIFQPDYLKNIRAPLALRISDYPVRRDIFKPKSYVEDTTTTIVDEEKVEEIAEESSVDILEFWESIQKWSSMIQNGVRSESKIPQYVRKQLVTFYKKNTILKNTMIQRLEMFDWFLESIGDGEDTKQDKATVAIILLEYVWDELLSANQQRKLLDLWSVFKLRNPSSGETQEQVDKLHTRALAQKSIYEEQYLFSGSTKAFRFVDPSTGQFRFICGDEECNEAIVELLEQSSSNKVRDLKANISTTGKLYGFLVPKKGEIVFKRAQPPVVGGKVGLGQECASSSAVTDHLKKLVLLGPILEKTLGKDFDISMDALTGERKFENQERICALTDIVLRFMDKKKLENKRWLYRPIASKIVGHKGRYEKVKEIKLSEKSRGKGKGKGKAKK
jgi:hypothetical protein